MYIKKTPFLLLVFLATFLFFFPSLVAAQETDWGECFSCLETMDWWNCQSVCDPYYPAECLEQPPQPVSVCEGEATDERVCTGWSGSSSPCGNLGPWHYCYPDACIVQPNSSQPGVCIYNYQYSYIDCSAQDSCLSGPYLYAGRCSDTGCTKGGLYKTCCELSGGSFTGNLGGDCRGGNYDGNCPAGSGTVMCGVDQATCNAVIAKGYNCTTEPCGQSACQAMVSSPPEPTPAPGDPTSTPIPTPSQSYCNWGGCTVMECCDSWIEVNVPREATVGDTVPVNIYQHPGWARTGAGCFYHYLGNTALALDGHLIAYGGEGAAGYIIDWDYICGFADNPSQCERTRAIYRVRNINYPNVNGQDNWGGFKSFPLPVYVGSYSPDPVYTTSPVGHWWYETRVRQTRVMWNTSGLPAGTYHFNNSSPTLSGVRNLRFSGHTDNCGASSPCCDKTIYGFGQGYSNQGFMHQIFGGEVNSSGRIIGDTLLPNRVIRLHDPVVCEDTAPSLPILSQPPNDHLLRTDEVGLTWTHDGEWGVNCAGNSNTFQVLVAQVDSGTPDFSALGSYHSQTVSSETSGIFLAVDYDSRYCWGVRADNGALSAESQVRCFTTLFPVGWFQGQSGNIYGHNGLTSLVSETVADWARYFSLNSEAHFGDSGLISSSPSTTKDFGDALAATKSNPDNDDWLVEADLSRLVNRYTYNYFTSILDVNPANPEIVFVTGGEGEAVEAAVNANPDQQVFVYQDDPSNNDGTLSITSPWDFTGRKVIVFFDGDINISLGNQEQLAPADFFALIASGNVSFLGNTGDTSGVYLGTASALGVFVAGDQIITSPGSNRFIGRGIFYARNGFSLGRDLGADNQTLPAELFRFDPKYLFTAPKVFRYSPQFWQELAP